MKTNGDVLREKLSKMSDRQLLTLLVTKDIITILQRTPRIYCGESFLSQPYEEPKRWYLHRHSTSLGKELYFDGYVNNENVFPNFSIKYTFENACAMRTALNEQRKHKKNLWLLGEVKDEMTVNDLKSRCNKR